MSENQTGATAMNKSLLIYILRKVWMFFLPVMLMLCGYVLFHGHPFGSGDTTAKYLGLLLGVTLAVGLFANPEKVDSFIYTRAVSRKRLFILEWGTGYVFLIFTYVLIALLILLHIRSALHSRSIFYPYVEMYDLHVLYPVCFASLLAYHVTGFMILATNYYYGKGNIAIKILWGTLVLSFSWLGFSFLLFGRGDMSVSTAGLYTCLCLFLTVYTSYRCYESTEIETLT